MSVSYCKEVTVTLSLLSCCQGLEIVDRLYNQCCGVQGTPHYPLLLSLFSLSLTPYTQLADPLLHVKSSDSCLSGLQFPLTVALPWLAR